MNKEESYKGPQCPPKEDFGHHICEDLKHLAHKEKETKRLVDFFFILLILVLFLVVAF